MNYNEINITKLHHLNENKDQLLYQIAILFAKTGFYEPSARIKYPEQDPFEIIIDKYLIPNANILDIIFYKNELIGFYMSHLITCEENKSLVDIPPMENLNWLNHGKAIYDFYDIYFKKDEFLVDNIAIKDNFRNQGLLTNVLYPLVLNEARRLKAKSLVGGVFKSQNKQAYQLYKNLGFTDVASLKFKLDEIRTPEDYIIEGRSEELVLLRFPIDQDSTPLAP